MGDSILPRTRANPRHLLLDLDSVYTSMSTVSRGVETLSPEPCFTSEHEDSQSDDDGDFTTSTRQHLRASRYGCNAFEDACYVRNRISEQGTTSDPPTDYVQYNSDSSNHLLSVRPLQADAGAGCKTISHCDSSLPRSCRRSDSHSLSLPNNDCSEGIDQHQVSYLQRPSASSLRMIQGEPSEGSQETNLDASYEYKTVNESTAYTFVSQCTIRPAVVPSLHESRSLQTVPHTQTGTKQGPVVNHLPRQERLENVQRVIAGVEKVFVASPAPTNHDPATALTPHQPTSASDQQNIPAKDGSVTDQKREPTPAEPNDSPESSQQYNASNSGHHLQSTKGQGGPFRHKHSGSGGRDRRGPYDRPNEDRSPITPSHAATPGRFCCVFNDSDNANPDCKKYHKFVSHLRVHHGGNGHQFYYCTTCFAKFTTKEQRDDHDPQHCDNAICVTIGCPNYDGASLPSCNHPGRANPQVFVWTRLFTMARPNQLVPSHLGIHAEPIATAGLSTLNTSTSYTYTPAPQIEPPPSQRSNLGTIPTNTSTGTSVATCGDMLYTTALQTLAFSLLKQLEEPDPNGLEVLEEMYTSYLANDAAEFRSQCGSDSCTAVVVGLQKLCHQMWRAARNPTVTQASQVSQLRYWAIGVLPHSDIPTRPWQATPSRRSRPEQSETLSPSEARNVRRKQKSPQFADSGGLDANFPQYPQQEDAIAPIDNQFPDFEFIPYNQPADIMQSMFSDIQPVYQHQFTGGAPAYMPWTQEDSAEAIPQSNNALTKPPTRDSGYWTGRSR